MTFKRLLMPALIMGIILTMGSMVYAQSTVNCGLADAATTDTVGPFTAVNGGTAIPATNIVSQGGFTLLGPSANAASTGHTEVIAAGPTRMPAQGNVPAPGGGTIRVWCANPGPAATPGVVVLTLSFGAPITNTTTFPSATTGIRLANGTNDLNTTTNVGISSVNNSAGTIVIGIGTPLTTTTVNPTTSVSFTSGVISTFDLQGVLLGTNGKSGEIDVTMTETSGNVNITTGTVAVISNVENGIMDPVVPSTLPSLVVTNTGLPAAAGGPAQLNSAGTPIKGNFTVKVSENFASMWQDAAQYNGGAVFPASPSSSTQVNFIFKNVPPGLTISNCVTTLTDPTGTIVNPNTVSTSAVASQNAVTSASNIITVNFSAALDLTATDVLWLSCTNVNSGTATLPLPAAPVTVQAELGPLGAALSSIGLPLTGLATGLIPRYQDTPQPTAGGIPVILFPPSQTTLLVPYAVVLPGFNTGIAVANTTTDVFTPANGGATPVAGTVIFTLFSNAGGTLSFTSPNVASGTTYAQNVSSMLPSGTTTFAGYIFAQANFPQAHGAATIYTTATGAAALSTPVLVVTSGASPGQNITLASPRQSPESLGQ